MKTTYLKMVFSITGQLMSMVKIQDEKALRVDPRSIALYESETTSESDYWRQVGYVDATAEEFNTFHSDTVKTLETISNPVAA